MFDGQTFDALQYEHESNSRSCCHHAPADVAGNLLLRFVDSQSPFVFVDVPSEEVARQLASRAVLFKYVLDLLCVLCI